MIQSQQCPCSPVLIAPINQAYLFEEQKLLSQSFATAYANSRPNAWAEKPYLSLVPTPVECNRENESCLLTDFVAS